MTKEQTYLTGGVVVGFAAYDPLQHREVPGTLTAYLTMDDNIQIASRVQHGIPDYRINFVLSHAQRLDLIHALGGAPLDADGVSEHERGEE